jgi:hydrogenase maturation protease
MPRVLIGGVGYRWMRDASFGVVAIDALAREHWPDEIDVVDLGYGALYAALDLADAQPRYDRVVVLAAARRDRAPGRLYPSRWEPLPEDDADLQERIREAGAGVIDVDHLLRIARHFGGLPDDVICIELEPSDVSGGDGLSESAAACVQEALHLARVEAISAIAGPDKARPGAAVEGERA